MNMVLLCIAGAMVIQLLCVCDGAAEQKNILLIVLDDLRADLAPTYTGNKKFPYLTTNIDKLAKKSTVFTNAHTQFGICSPSRESFLSGRRPDSIQVFNFLEIYQNKYPDLRSLPQVFEDAGYYTVGVGKIFHQLRNFSDTYEANYHEKAFNEVHLIDRPNICQSKSIYCLCEDFKKDKKCIDSKITKLAIKKIKKLKKKKQPWFVSVGYRRPHLDFIIPKKMKKSHIEKKSIALSNHKIYPENLPEIGFQVSNTWTKKKQIRELDRGDFGIYINTTIPDELAETIRKYYFASLVSVDQEIKKLLKQVQKRKDTIVVITSDHGLALGEKGMWSKETNFEEITKVPLIVFTPWIKDSIGKRVSQPVELLDLMPTLLDLAGVEAAGKQCEGQSLVPFLHDASHVNQNKQYALSQIPRCNVGSENEYVGNCPLVSTDRIQAMGYSIRTPNYRYTEWREWNKTKAVWTEDGLLATELYDHTGNDWTDLDNYEVTNLALDEAYLSTREGLRALLHAAVNSPTYTAFCAAA